MDSIDTTRASLLLRIRDPRNRIAWGEFVELYAPLVHAYGMKHRLQDADAADLAQEVLRRVARARRILSMTRREGSSAAGCSR